MTKKADSHGPALLISPTRHTGIDTVHHIAAYHPPRNGHQEPVSAAIEEFRKGRSRAVRRWTALVPLLAGTLHGHDIIIRALYCDETEICEASPLDRLCDAVAEVTGASYSPNRLTKVRTTQPLQGLGGHAAHGKELEEVFRFDPSGLRGPVRVLIVDDVISTGATLEAIAGAVHEALPEACVSAFVLGCTESAVQNTHLDTGYFMAPGNIDPPATAAFADGKKNSRAARPAVRRPAAMAPPPAAPDRTAARPRSFAVYAVGIGLAILVVAALVPLRAGRPVTLPDLALADTALPAAAPAAVAAPAVPAPVPTAEPRKNLRPAKVTVPQAGLRTDHSFDAPMLHKVTVRAGETVEIVRRHVASSGPDWYLIRNHAGRTGWVMASVVSRTGIRH